MIIFNVFQNRLSSQIKILKPNIFIVSFYLIKMEIAIERWSLNFTDPDVERLYQKIEAKRSRLFRLGTLLGCVLTECIIIPMDLLSYFNMILL